LPRRDGAALPRHHHPRPYRRPRAVVLDAERLQQRRRLLSFDVLEVEAVPVAHPAAAKREDLHRGLVAIGREPEPVDVADAPLFDGLPLAQPADREEAVAVARRLLEALALGRVVHLPLELALDRARVAGEEVDDAVDDLGVGLLRDLVDAGRVAALDVVVEAG